MKTSYLIVCLWIVSSFSAIAAESEGSGSSGSDATSQEQVLSDPATENFPCLSSGPSILAICAEEMEVITKTIDFSQAEQSSEADLEEVYNGLQLEGLPRQACCNIAMNFNAAACHCDPVLVKLLPEAGVAVPALMSIFSVMERTCGSFQTRTCQ